MGFDEFNTIVRDHGIFVLHIFCETIKISLSLPATTFVLKFNLVPLVVSVLLGKTDSDA
jgi:hypothetical protein